MFVSAEILAIVISAVGVLLAVGCAFAGFASWIVRRLDLLEQRLGARIDGVGAKSEKRDTSLDAKLEQRTDALAAEIGEVKVAVARLEGPERRFYAAAR